MIIIDFGTATEIGSKRSGGNDLYSPPEAVSSNLTVHTSYDVFGVGSIMYEILSGQNLFNHPSSTLRWNDVPQHTFPMTKVGLTGSFTPSSIYYDNSVKIPIKHNVNSALDPNPDTRSNLETIMSNLIAVLGCRN